MKGGGTAHFRVSIGRGLAIMRSLRGHMSGLCVPQFMIDLPDGGGKIPLLTDYVKETGEETMVVENYRGNALPTRSIKTAAPPTPVQRWESSPDVRFGIEDFLP